VAVVVKAAVEVVLQLAGSEPKLPDSILLPPSSSFSLPLPLSLSLSPSLFLSLHLLLLLLLLVPG
jgi:hypothetical protein